MKKELVYNPKTGSFNKESKRKSIKDGEYNPETGSFERKFQIKKTKKTASKPRRIEKLKKKSKNLKKKSKIKKVKKSASKLRRTEKLKKKSKNLKKNKKQKKITKTRKSKKSGWADSYDPVTGSFEKRSERKSKKKSEQRKILHMYGYEYFEDEFLEGAQETINHLAEHFKKSGITLKYPLANTDKGKYWDCRNIYPASKSDFIEKFFKKRNPVGIEGIWEHKLIGTSGIVKEGSHYQIYNIECWFKDKAPPNFFDKVLYGSHDIDYSITSGTKTGALFPTSDKAIFKFEGVSAIIFSPEENQVSPANLLVSGDVIINEKGNMYTQLFPPAPGMESHRIWPNKPVIVEEKIEDSKKSVLSFGTGFFVSKKGHIITNFHVVRNSNNIKFLYNDDEVDAKLIESDQQLDLALLKSKVKNKSNIKFSNKSPQKAQNILVAGFPFGKAISSDLKITGGIINSLKGTGDDTTRLQIDATINPGNSGGPIVDKVNGCLVGVAVAKLNKDFTKEVFGAEGENTNYGIKASQVRDFLESNNINVSVKSSKLKISELEESTVFIYNK